MMHIRRNGEWATTAFGVGTSSVTVTGSTQDSWVVRYATSTRNQSRVDLTCTAGQAVDSCTVAARGNDVRLDWNKVADAERYQVRSNGKWVASTPATGVTVPGSTEDTWIIRTRVKGAVVDLPCSADGIEPTSPCTVTIVNDLTVNIDWDDVDGVDRYQVRANGRWQGSSTTSDFDYSPVRVEFALGSPYEIRYWSNGERNSIFC